MITIKKITIFPLPERDDIKYEFHEMHGNPSIEVCAQLATHLKESNVTPLVYENGKVYRARKVQDGLHCIIEKANAEEVLIKQKYEEFLPIVQSVKEGWTGKPCDLPFTDKFKDYSKPNYRINNGFMDVSICADGIRLGGFLGATMQTLFVMAEIEVDEEKCEKCGQKLL